MSEKKDSRLRRAKKTRLRIRELGHVRLAVHRTTQHMYAQVISACGGKVLASASTLESGFDKNGSNKEAASLVGRLIAERARAQGIEKVAFDRAGFKYHGRIKALADAARENGLQF